MGSVIKIPTALVGARAYPVRNKVTLGINLEMHIIIIAVM